MLLFKNGHHSLRSLQQLMVNGSIPKTSVQTSRFTIPSSQIRSLVYLKPKKSNGIKRPEAEYLVSSQGNQHGTSPSNLESVKMFLGDKYKISDELVLQAITHKSFAHGLKPYNEKLAIMGM